MSGHFLAVMEAVSVSILKNTDDLCKGESRAIVLRGLDTVVFVDAEDHIVRVRHRGQEGSILPALPWSVEQVLRDVLDPHAI